MQTALLRLFHAVKVENKEVKSINKSIFERTVREGYILSPFIHPDNNLIQNIEMVLGLSSEKMNNSFHKSWKTVAESSDEQLVIQQIIHYITTYGYQNLGIFDEDTVYIPDEILDIPEGSIPLTVIKSMTEDEIRLAIEQLGCGIALNENTLSDIMTVIKSCNLDKTLINNIHNRELLIRLCDYYGVCPNDPEEYLRYLVYKITGNTLLIKNNALIQSILDSQFIVDKYLKDAPPNLASIFFRYKPIFIAIKNISDNKHFFNRLRKNANKQHVPLSEDYLNSVTSKIKSNKLVFEDLKKRLQNTIVFRKIRLANALNFRSNNPDSIVYRIRNGRGWASTFDWPEECLEDTTKALDIVLKSIATDIEKKVQGKSFYIPKHVEYSLPATEKQFTGEFPTGSYIRVNNDMVAGIHWTNTSRAIDLDLSLMDASGKIGWDGQYRSDERDILFSGDVTNAPNPKGASELFYLKKTEKDLCKLMFVNYYNYNSEDPVTFKLLVSDKKPNKFNQNYMVNPNDVLATTYLDLNVRQDVLALIRKVNDELRFYFANVKLGNSITSVGNNSAETTRKYFIHNTTNMITLRTMLLLAGANLLDEKPQNSSFIDLSPECLNKTSIIQLLK